MWIKLEKTKEFIPVNEQMTEKVFLDGQKGWCVKQKDGSKYYLTDKEREALDQEIDREAYWRKKEIENAAKQLSEDELRSVRKMLDKKKKEEDE